MIVILKNRSDMLQFIKTLPCYSHLTDEEYLGFSVTKFTGNQWNESWEWDIEKLQNCSECDLVKIIEDRKPYSTEVEYYT